MLLLFAREAAGAQNARHSLRPLFFEGQLRRITRAFHAAGMQSRILLFEN
jgi:hypothetical protein